MSETTETKSAASTQAVPVQMDDLPALHPTKPGGETIGLGHILDVTVPVTVELGQTRLSIAGLAQLAPGSLVTLEREAHEPVDILVNGRLIARGEVVTVGERYGVRIISMAG
jgi:flagellar motor switch protein FliN/FliY